VTVPQDPWAPPQVAGVSVNSGSEPERPRRILSAMRWIWIGYWFSLALAIWALAKPALEPAAGPDAELDFKYLEIAFFASIFLAAFWLNCVLGQGREWARIVYIALTALSALAIPPLFFLAIIGEEPWLELMLDLVGYGIGFYACYLLMTREAGEWFRAMGER
jgi:hypothetical protein